MDINIYNELYKDFNNLYEQSKKIVEESKISQQQISNYIDDNSPNLPIEGMFKSMMSIIKYNEMAFSIINKLETINDDYTKKFREQIQNNPNQFPKLPQLFILFRKLIRNLHDENYEECNRLKNKILNRY